MPYIRKVKIKGKDYWYLFHTIREGEKFLKKSKYVGRELPKNIEEIKERFLKEIKGEKVEERKDDVSKLVESLSPLEREVLPLIEEGISSKELEDKSKLTEVEVIRALQWLENKSIIKINIGKRKIIELRKNGKKYLKEGLPEKRLLKAVIEKSVSFDEAREKAGLDKDEFNVSLGILKRDNAIMIKEDKISKSKEVEFLEEELLKKLPLDFESLNKDEVKLLEALKKRRDVVNVEEKKVRTIKLTNLGNELKKRDLKLDLIENLTSDLLRSEKWKSKRFRRYDIKINVPRIYQGRRHFVNEAISYVRRIWLDLGFKEMKGSLIQSSFWNFDALFTPQDHPARDLQDSIFLKSKSELPDSKLVNAVKKMHESGGYGSKGWRYKWDLELAKKDVLRTHTTVLSARTLANLKKEKIPGKFFAIGDNFRNETLDWSHLFEIIQTEGIVVSEDVNFRHLLGYLKEFFNKMGFSRVRFRPAFFPYTSMSCEVDVYIPEKKRWIELGGSGIFRPEVVIPLMGKDIPVLAWGLGLGRIIMDYYNIKDIRELYANDLRQLREVKMWLR